MCVCVCVCVLFPPPKSERQILGCQSDVFYVDLSTEKQLHKNDGMVAMENLEHYENMLQCVYVFLSAGT